MSIEMDLRDALRVLAPGRAWPNRAPQGTTGAPPYVVFQQVGGVPTDFVELVRPDKNNARFQVSVWGDNFDAVTTLAKSIEDALVVSAVFRARRQSARIGMFDSETKYHGSRQDFSIWS
jgi:hypothetical protein